MCSHLHVVFLSKLVHFKYNYTISLFSDTILNDNTGCDLNTAAGRDTNCNPVKPTESPVMNSDKCNGAARVNLKCDRINHQCFYCSRLNVREVS